MAATLQGVLNQIAQQNGKIATILANQASAASVGGFGNVTKSGNISANAPGAVAAGNAAAAAISGPVGVAAEAIGMLKRSVEELVSAAQRFSVAALASVAAYKPFQVYLFTRRLMDLSAVFGSILLPVLHQAISVLRSVADYLYNLPPGFRAVVRAVGTAAVILGVIGTAIAAVTAVAVPLVVVMGTILGPIAELSVGIAAFLSATAGGNRLLQTAWTLVEKLFAGIYEMVQAVWSFTEPIRAIVADAFSGLADAFSDLLDAIEPIAAVLIKIVGGVLIALAYVIGAIATAVVRLVQVLVYFTNAIIFLVGWLLKLVGFHLPDVAKSTGSAFGLAAQGGHITSDVAGMKTKLEETILANTGRERDDPATRTAKATETLVQDVKAIRGKMDKDDKKDDAVSGRHYSPGHPNSPAYYIGHIIGEIFGH
jgi:phage-related protein